MQYEEITKPEKEVVIKILDVISRNKTFFITSHIQPDGDSFGSELALASYLESIGKEVYIAMVDPLPFIYQFLPGSEKIKVEKKVKKVFDVAFILDCTSEHRIGGIIDLKKQAKIVVDIDHHINSSRFGDINFVSHRFSAVAEQIYYLLKEARSASGTKLTFKEALCIYVGILTETGRFQESNTTPQVFSIASKLLKLGISPKEISGYIYENKTFQRQKLLGIVLSTLRFNSISKIATLEINEAMYRRTGTGEQDTEDFINYASMISGVKVAILFKEQKHNIKVSFRSKSEIDVRKIAAFFKGGGHTKAAGCKIKGKLKEVKKQVLDVVKKSMRDFYE